MPEAAEKGVIRGVIAHINTLEEKINALKDSITEADDLVTVNKLDIINLKNDIEKIKMSMPEVSMDTLSNLKELEKISGNVGQIEKWKGLERDIAGIKAKLEKKERSNVDDMAAGLELINQRVLRLEATVGEPEEAGHKKHTTAISELNKKIEDIEKTTSNIKHCPACGALMKDNAKFCNKCGKRM